jgi:hypothetical protein
MEMTEEPAKETEVGVLASHLDERALVSALELLHSGIEEEMKKELSVLLVSPYSKETERALGDVTDRLYDPTLNAIDGVGGSWCFVTGCSEARVPWWSFCETHKDTCFVEEDRPGFYLNCNGDDGRCRVRTAKGWRWVKFDADGYDAESVRFFVEVREDLDFSLEAGEIRRAGTTPWGASIYERLVANPRSDLIAGSYFFCSGSISHYSVDHSKASDPVNQCWDRPAN